MGGARLYKVGSPFNAVELFSIDYAQSFDTMYLAHIDHPVRKLTREDHDEWLFSTVSFGPTIAAPANVSATATNPNQDAANGGNAYFPQNATYTVSAVNEETGQESRATSEDTANNDLGLKRNYNTITWNSVTGATLYRVYKANNSGSFGYIGETTELTFVDDNINPDLSDAPIIGENPFDAAGNYPSTLCFFEQRLFFGRTRNYPNAIFSSRSADFENMDRARPARADDAISISATSGKVNAVNQLVPANNLLALTSDSIFEIVGANDDYLSPTPPPKVRRQNGRGASDLKALLIDSVTFFQPAIGSEIRTLGFSYEIEGLTSNDVSVFSPQFFEDHRIIDWAFAQEPLSVIWAVRDDGKLLAFTWQQEHQVWGWTEMVIDGDVRSVCVVPEIDEDRLYLLIRRTIDGATRYYVERMATSKWTALENACYLDCAVTQIFTEETSTIDRLSHLEGKEVWALADGFVVKGLTVENGAVTLPDPALVVTVGLPMVATIETLPLNVERPDGSAVGATQITGRAHLRIVETLGVTAGRVEGDLSDVTTREDEGLGSQADLYTGIVRVQMGQAVRFETTLLVQQANPLPMKLTGAYIEVDGAR